MTDIVEVVFESVGEPASRSYSLAKRLRWLEAVGAGNGKVKPRMARRATT